MLKYVIQFVNTANSFPNLDFDNRYIGQSAWDQYVTHKGDGVGGQEA